MTGNLNLEACFVPLNNCSTLCPNTHNLSCFSYNVLCLRNLSVLAGYMPAPGMPSMMAPPGAPSMPMPPLNSLPRPPTMNVPPAVPGSTSTPTSGGAPSMMTQPMYQANPAGPTSGGFDSFNINAQGPEANH